MTKKVRSQNRTSISGAPFWRPFPTLTKKKTYHTSLSKTTSLLFKSHWIPPAEPKHKHSSSNKTETHLKTCQKKSNTEKFTCVHFNPCVDKPKNHLAAGASKQHPPLCAVYCPFNSKHYELQIQMSVKWPLIFLQNPETFSECHSGPNRGFKWLRNKRNNELCLLIKDFRMGLLNWPIIRVIFFSFCRNIGLN